MLELVWMLIFLFFALLGKRLSWVGVWRFGKRVSITPFLARKEWGIFLLEVVWVCTSTMRADAVIGSSAMG